MLYKLSILIAFVAMLGCANDPLDYSKKEAFEDLHSSVANYSASIDSRQINWDSVGSEYRTLVNEDLSEQAFFSLMGDMMLNFRDPHVWLISPFESMYSIDNLGYDRNYDESLIGSYVSDLEEHSPTIKSGFINDSIGYLLCLDFKGDQVFNSNIYRSVIAEFIDTKGLVIDLRDNDGGSVYNAQHLLNLLGENRNLWHTTQNRISEGFDKPYDWFIEPSDGLYYPNEVIVLNGRYTISAGERFAIGAKLLDNITIVGDTTANTQGSVMGREMLNGWAYTLTFEKCLDPNGVNYAGVGIPPDYYIKSKDAIEGSRDKVLEKALELLQ